MRENEHQNMLIGQQSALIGQLFKNEQKGLKDERVTALVQNGGGGNSQNGK